MGIDWKVDEKNGVLKVKKLKFGRCVLSDFSHGNQQKGVLDVVQVLYNDFISISTYSVEFVCVWGSLSVQLME